MQITASYGNFKHGTYIKVIGVGTVSLNVTNHLTASKSGLTIRKSYRIQLIPQDKCLMSVRTVRSSKNGRKRSNLQNIA